MPLSASEFLAKYPANLDGPSFVDAMLATITNDIRANLAHSVRR